MASMPAELDVLAAGGSAPVTPSCSTGGNTPLAGGGGSFDGSVATSAANDAPPRLYVDLRPFMDRAPTTVRCVH